jgi:pimeloyl-ACP methyl ester carboxylesterase
MRPQTAPQRPFETGTIVANGIEFHYLAQGEGPLVLCLHGFPDCAHSYASLLPALASAGFRAVAPFMRGYAPSGRPADQRYHSVLLAQDALALIEARGAERAHVGGHDWGGFAAFGAAALAPERVERLVVLAVAHPAALGRHGMDYDMIRGMWHVWFFQMPFAEKAVAADDFAFVERWWRDASPNYDPPAEVMEPVKATFRQPGVVEAALAYYRHGFDPARQEPELAALQARINAPTRVPTLALHGTHDRPGRLEAFEAMDDLFTAGLEKVILPGTGHFLHLEAPEEVNGHIVRFLSGGA